MLGRNLRIGLAVSSAALASNFALTASLDERGPPSGSASRPPFQALSSFLRPSSTATSYCEGAAPPQPEAAATAATPSFMQSASAALDKSKYAPRRKYTAEEEYPHFDPVWHTSLMRKYMTPEVFAELQNKKTTNGYTLNKIIGCGVSCGYSVARGMGLMAGDYECYKVFAPLFDPIIAEYHNYSKFSKHVTDLNPGHLRNVANLDPKGLYVLSTRIRVARSIAGYSFPPGMSRGERREVESLSRLAVEGLGEDLGGMYISLNDMDNEQNDDLIQRHILFDNPDEWGITTGLGKDWPDSRGLFVNVQTLDNHPDFVVWVNEEDHLRIMCMRKGGDIFAVFEKMVRGINEIEAALKAKGKEFLYDDRLGYMAGCPTNLGTGLRASCVSGLDCGDLNQCKVPANTFVVGCFCLFFSLSSLSLSSLFPQLKTPPIIST